SWASRRWTDFGGWDCPRPGGHDRRHKSWHRLRRGGGPPAHLPPLLPFRVLEDPRAGGTSHCRGGGRAVLPPACLRRGSSWGGQSRSRHGTNEIAIGVLIEEKDIGGALGLLGIQASQTRGELGDAAKVEIGGGGSQAEEIGHL